MSNRLLVFNVHFAPTSFGGATVVAEELIGAMQSDHDWEVLVFTSHVDHTTPAYTLRRYRARDCDVISINLSQGVGYEESYCNPQVDRVVLKVLERYQPDLVHCHAVQLLGCGYFQAIKDAGTPLVVTVHDSWWLCDRQFMIDGHGRFCFQKKIDSNRCRYCVNLPEAYLQRTEYLRGQLSLADLVLAPSEYQRDLYNANGFSCSVNMNGIVRPRSQLAKSAHRKVQFGFIGGPGDIKGADVIVAALQGLREESNYNLLVVDAAQNIGSSWRNTQEWNIPGDLQFHPAYTQRTIDQFFAKIDVLLFPSQWRESFGLTIREALARDVWVIATGEGGVAEAIAEGVNGQLLPLSPDPHYLQVAIKECLASPQRWQHYENPYKSRIRYFDEQAAELNSLFLQLMVHPQ